LVTANKTIEPSKCLIDGFSLYLTLENEDKSGQVFGDSQGFIAIQLELQFGVVA